MDDFGPLVFIDAPVLRTDDHEYNWMHLEVKESPGKVGVGVFCCKSSIPAGLAIPYCGERIDGHRLQSLVSHNSLGYCNYLADERVDEHGKVVTWVDAHPRRYRRLYPRGPRYAWIGGLVNEAGAGETPNAELIAVGQFLYQHLYDNLLGITVTDVFLKTAREIQPGEEILTRYGYRASEYKRLGYNPYPAATVVGNDDKPTQGKKTTTDHTNYWESRKRNWEQLNQLLAVRRERKKQKRLSMPKRKKVL